MFDEIRMYWRFARGLRRFLNETIDIDDAIAIARETLAKRETHFLRIVERAIYG